MKTFASNKSEIWEEGTEQSGKALNNTTHHLCTVPWSCQLTYMARNFKYFFFFAKVFFHISYYCLFND